MNNISCTANLIGPTKTLFLVINGISSCASITGNGLVILVILSTRLRRNQSNYFILSLTIGDLLVGVLVNPLYIIIVSLDVWMENSLFMIIENYLWIQSLTVTTFSLCLISIERYIAISKPFNYRYILTKKRCIISISCVWIFSFLVGCTSFIIKQDWLVNLWAVCSVIVVFLPLGTMAYFYFQIFQEVSRHKTRMKKDSLELNVSRKNQKANVTIGIIVGLFICCFAPSLVFSLITMIQTDKCLQKTLYKGWIWAIWVNFSSSAINPWIYALRTHDFQLALTTCFHNKFSLKGYKQRSNYQSREESIL